MATATDFLDTVTKYTSYLGHGSYGFVVKAEHKDKTCTCIKFIYPTEDEKLLLQTQRERSLTIKLPEHRHIVTIKNSIDKRDFNPTFSAFARKKLRANGRTN
ncbi:Mitogen-activated protein kinase 3 [Folsomia candida]|uniref:Mitogen-activated protein kinase 3 n=1 Tax=Folsomia candida TaxID=158441 RepID=A0A226D412_FOLCA|nr:Mitogen-activated protein kinase 3 [Folsomia candida]